MDRADLESCTIPDNMQWGEAWTVQPSVGLESWFLIMQGEVWTVLPSEGLERRLLIMRGEVWAVLR